MKKFIEKDPSYYKINLNTGNLIYLSHALKVADNELIEINIKDIVYKIDALVDAVNSLEQIIVNTDKSEKTTQ